MSAAHEKEFTLVREKIETHVVQQNEVIQLTSLRLTYVQELRRVGCENDNYRCEKLLRRLQNDPINDRIDFTKVQHRTNHRVSFWFVHSSKISVSEALAQAYHLGAADKYQAVALLLRGDILDAFSKSEDLPWPPTANNMELRCGKVLPPELIRFLSVLMDGKEEVGMTEKLERLVFSIGQDLCRAVTEGKWILPKHVLLCVTVRHLFRSKQLTKILHRLGHSESYDFGLELETALAKAIDEVSTHLTPKIVTGEGNIVFHCEWDNLNKTTTNVHGNNIVNSAGGIMLQEVKPGFEINQSPVEDEAWQLREDPSGWTSDQEAIRLQELPRKRRQQEAALPALAACMERSTGCISAGENQDGHPHCGRESPSTCCLKWRGKMKAYTISVMYSTGHFHLYIS